MVEALVAIGIAGAGVLGLTTIAALNAKSQKTLNSTLRMEELRERITDVIRDPASWATTVQNSANLNCLKTASDCRALSNPAQPNAIRIFSADGTQLTDDGSNPRFGFDLDGKPCSAFSNSGNADCPFRVNVTWTAICDPNPVLPCMSPGARLQGTIVFNPGGSDNPNLNQNLRSFNLTVGKMFSLYMACKAVSGNFDPATSTCRLNMVGKSCPSGQVVVGIEPDTHIMICGPLWTGSCPGGRVLQGVNGGGAPTCIAVQCI